MKDEYKSTENKKKEKKKNWFDWIEEDVKVASETVVVEFSGLSLWSDRLTNVCHVSQCEFPVYWTNIVWLLVLNVTLYLRTVNKQW